VKGLRATLFMDIGEPKRGDAAPFTVHCRCRAECGPAASWRYSRRCA
jgi:hypothetical protein